MSTEEGRSLFEYGPYVQIAAFCEKVLREGDGVLSLIRVVDVISHTERGADPPRDMPEMRYPLTLVITLKAGRTRDREVLCSALNRLMRMDVLEKNVVSRVPKPRRRKRQRVALSKEDVRKLLAASVAAERVLLALPEIARRLPGRT